MTKLFPELVGDVPVLPAHTDAPLHGDELDTVGPTPKSILDAVPQEARPSFADMDVPATSAQATQPSVRYIGGVEAIATFNRILGLPGRFTDQSGECQVRSVQLHPDGHITIDVAGGGVPPRTLWLWPKGKMPNPPLSGEDFDIGIRGSTKEQIVGMLLASVGRQLVRVPLDLLAQVVSQDSTGSAELVETDAERQARTAQQAAASSRRRSRPPKDLALPSLIDSWGGTTHWRNFFADDAQRRNFCHNLSGSVVTVSHEDLECHYSTPSFGDGAVSFFNYPPIHDRYVANTAENEHADARIGGALHLSTDLHDLDVIKGGTNKLDHALETLAERESDVDLVVVKATCVPVVIGDDMEGSVEKFRAKSKIPVVFVNTKEDPFASPLRSTYRAVRGDLEFKHPVKRPGSVNLLGFPRAEEIRFLLDFLDEMGVQINSRLLPDIDLKILRRYRAADLSILADTKLYDRTYEEVFGDIDVPTIRPPAPYGITGTKKWLREVASALGHDGGFEALWHKRAGALEAEFVALSREAAGYAVGFVVDSVSVAILLEPSRSAGVPILDMLREMGFAIDFLVFASEDDPAAEETVAALREFAHSVQTFTDPESLGHLLRSSRAQAFYSETFFDRRLTRSGKAQFSLALTQMGADGAVASLKRILAVCKMPFYRRYSGYLGKPFDMGAGLTEAAQQERA